jgi:hypothetical protein
MWPISPRVNKPHRRGRERPHQLMRIRLVAQPAEVVGGRQDERHAIVNFRHQFVGLQQR